MTSPARCKAIYHAAIVTFEPIVYPDPSCNGWGFAPFETLDASHGRRAMKDRKVRRGMTPGHVDGPIDLEKSTRNLALSITLNCVRTSCIETFHANGKLTDTDMKAFNKEVHNRIYTFLHVFLNGMEPERSVFLNKMLETAIGSTPNWDPAEIDRKMLPLEPWKPGMPPPSGAHV